ncbi:hypothetical protein [Cohaesibacter celericrescens]|nr:hypothetical protein [Cohaesibacter celericrescens]
MKLPNVTSAAFINTTLACMVGIFAAGYMMNMFRSNSYVAQAIDGYDG